MITKRGTRAYGDHKSQHQLHHTSARNIIYHQSSNNNSHKTQARTHLDDKLGQTTATHVEGTALRY